MNMSNLQDVPLADPEGLPITDSQAEVPVSKTRSLRRFFKISRKPAVKDFASETSFDGGNKELGKSSTFSRLFARRKGSNKDAPEQSSSLDQTIEKEKPLATPKPVIKPSMSIYWRRLFNMHKNRTRDMGSGPEQSAVNGPEEVHELQLVQNDPENQTDLDEPDLDLNQESQPPTVSEPEPEPEKTIVGEQIISVLGSGHRQIDAEPKDGVTDPSALVQ